MSSSTSSSVEDLARELSYLHERGATSLELVERSATDERVVESWPLARVFDPRPIAAGVQARADQHARRGRSYAMQAYATTGPGEAVASLIGYVLVGITSRGVEESRVADHTALERDVVSQAVRHNEVLLRGAAANVDGIISHYSQLLEDERRFRRAAEDKCRELEVRLVQYASSNDDRDQRTHDRTLELMRFEVFAEPVKLLMPLLVSKAIAHKAPPGTAPPAILGEELLGKFLESLDEDQQASIYQTLRPTQQMLLAQLYTDYGARSTARKGKAESATPSAAASPANGTPDAVPGDPTGPDTDEPQH